MDNIRFFRVKSTSSVFFFAGSGSKGKNIFTRLYILSGYDNIFCSGFRGEGLQPASEDRYGDGSLDRESEQLLIYIDTGVYFVHFDHFHPPANIDTGEGRKVLKSL